MNNIKRRQEEKQHILERLMCQELCSLLYIPFLSFNITPQNALMLLSEMGSQAQRGQVLCLRFSI